MHVESRQGQDAVRLNARDGRVLFIWLLAAIAGILIANRYFFQAFPEASVNFQVTREAALDRARAFVTAQGIPLQGYQATIVFSVDDNQKTYLERELGLDQANRLMSSDVSVWYWDARFFKPLQKEEFRVGVDPSGRIVGYQHVLEEGAPGARLERDAAFARAESFLRGTLQAPIGAYTFLPAEANSSVRPNRTDWSFTWERTGFRAKDAPYRLKVNLAGDRIGGYQEGLQVPESWQRDYQRLRSRNNLIAAVATISYAVLLGAALAIAFSLGRRGLAPWSGALGFGLFIAALYFLMQMNQWPLARSEYDTNGSYSSFIFSQIGLAAGASLAIALTVIIPLVPGEPWYRAMFPEKLRLGGMLCLPAFRTKQFFISGWIGLCLAAAHIGYVVLFYVVGKHFGVWAPQDLQYSDTLSTALPWIYPLTIGIYAATSEEFLFRLFAVPWLLRLTRSTAIAVILPAFAWGFLHANYPQEPAYIRGIEVGTIGIVAGLVMLRWGILATLTWHYTVDAFMVGMSLMRSADWYSRISGTLVGFGAFIPVAIAGVLYLRRGSFVEPALLLNSAVPLVEPVVEETEPVVVPESIAYQSLSARAMIAFGVCAIAALGLVLFTKTAQIGDSLRFSIDAAQAQTLSDAALRGGGVDPASYRRAATVQYRLDPQVNEYLRRSIGIDAANKLYETEAPGAYWTVRYFRDSQKEEYLVVLRTDGRLHAIHHTLPEEAPGANLSKEAAQQKAEMYLTQVKMIDLSQWKVVDANSDKLPARTDHVFTWEQKKAAASLGDPAFAKASAGEDEGAHVRMELRVQGDEVSGYRVFVHLPEEWVRKQNQETLATTLHRVGLAGLIGAFIVAVLAIFLRNLKQPQVAAVPWTRLVKWSVVVLIAFVCRIFTSIPQYLAAYPTENSFSTYLSMTVISLVLSSAAIVAGVAVLFGLAWFFLQQAFGRDKLPGWHGMPAAYYRDALVVGFCGCAISFGAVRLRELLEKLWPVAHFGLSAAPPLTLDASLPALQLVAVSILQSMVGVSLLGLIVGFFALYFRDLRKVVAILGLVAFLISPRWGSAADLLQNFIVDWIALLLIWWAVHRIIRFNLLAYFLAATLLLTTAAAIQLLQQPNAYFHANAIALIIAMAGMLLWPLYEWRQGLRSPVN